MNNNNQNIECSDQDLESAVQPSVRYQITSYDSVLAKEHLVHFLPPDSLFETLVEVSKEAVRISPDRASTDFHKKNSSVVIYGELDGNGKTTDHLVGRPYLVLDIDQKAYPEKMSFQQITDHISSLGLDSINYTTLSHRQGNSCCRVVVDIGRSIGPSEYVRAVEWMISTFPFPEIIDNASKNPVQQMLPPRSYCYVPNKVTRTRGRSLYDLYEREICAEPLPTPSLGRKSAAKAAPICGGEAVQMFWRATNALHRDLIPYHLTKTSAQFYRNSKDDHPGLFCFRDGYVVYDRATGRNYKLFYSLADFHEAANHVIDSKDHVTEQMLSWDQSGRGYAVLLQNPGTGKSQILVHLASIPAANGARRIFTFHTRKKRDEFIRSLFGDTFVIVYSNIEILESIVSDERRLPEIKEKLLFLYSENMKETHSIDKSTDRGDEMFAFLDSMSSVEYASTRFDSMLRKIGLLSEAEIDEISKEVKSNNARLTCGKHVITTTSKLEFIASYSDSVTAENAVVYTDEVKCGMLTDKPIGEQVTVYGKVKYKWQDDSLLNKPKLRALKRCLITVEEMIVHELNALNMSFTRISSSCKTLDANLEVLVVSSTSSVINLDSGISPRAEVLRDVHSVYGDSVNVIADGLKSHGHFLNTVNSKGMNNLQDKPLVCILGHPSPEELGHAMLVTGLDEERVKSIISSDKANQSIGRNQGYRNRNADGAPSLGGNRCLLIVPDSMNLQLQFVSPNCVRLESMQGSTPDASFYFSQAQKFWFKDLISHMVGSDDSKVKLVKAINAAKDELGALGVILLKSLTKPLNLSESINKAARIVRELGFNVVNTTVDAVRGQYVKLS